jgi:hypothetical protein
MATPLVVWILLYLSEGTQNFAAFPDRAQCEAVVGRARLKDIAVSDCVRVEFPAPYAQRI